MLMCSKCVYELRHYCQSLLVKKLNKSNYIKIYNKQYIKYKT